jgi:hypothetical protein
MHVRHLSCVPMETSLSLLVSLLVPLTGTEQAPKPT